jgi:hypothetical protein
LTPCAHDLLIGLYEWTSRLLEVTDQMAQILVTREDGEIFWNETVTPSDFRDEHFRRCLAERLGWAVADTETFALRPAATRDMNGVTRELAAAA